MEPKKPRSSPRDRGFFLDGRDVRLLESIRHDVQALSGCGMRNGCIVSTLIVIGIALASPAKAFLLDDSKEFPMVSVGAFSIGLMKVSTISLFSLMEGLWKRSALRRLTKREGRRRENSGLSSPGGRSTDLQSDSQ